MFGERRLPDASINGAEGSRSSRWLGPRVSDASSGKTLRTHQANAVVAPSALSEVRAQPPRRLWPRLPHAHRIRR